MVLNPFDEGDWLQSDDELHAAVLRGTVAEIRVFDQIEFVGEIQGFNQYLVQMEGNHFYFRRDIQIIVAFCESIGTTLT